ncbi:MAG: hypothetical protein FGM37_05390 [Phycisphaerales bacterium]|nr:hypothetical protein [Phycisphaerales bacterium]
MAHQSAQSHDAPDAVLESVLWRTAAETAARIERIVSGARRTLAEAGVQATLVEGSALSAELSSPDELVLRYASRASLSVACDDLARARYALADAGWRPMSAQGDIHLLLAAARHGRHLVFALIDEGSGDEVRGLHPTHPRAVKLREERLSRWRASVVATFGRHESRTDDLGRSITESIELGLVESQDQPSESHRSQVP